jgi:hypothetical protein
MDFSVQHYPVDSLRNVMPVFPFPNSSIPYRMERCCKGQLHEKDTLRSTNRGGAVALHPKDIKDHTHPDESDENKEKEDTEEEKPRNRQKLSPTGHGVTTMKSGPVTTTISFNRLRRSKAVEKHGRIKPCTKGTGSTSAVLCDVSHHLSRMSGLSSLKGATQPST